MEERPCAPSGRARGSERRAAERLLCVGKAVSCRLGAVDQEGLRGGPLSCPRCGKPMKALAVITDPAQVLKILRHLIRKGTPPPVSIPPRSIDRPLSVPRGGDLFLRYSCMGPPYTCAPPGHPQVPSLLTTSLSPDGFPLQQSASRHARPCGVACVPGGVGASVLAIRPNGKP
jgi:hypothetical protein